MSIFIKIFYYLIIGIGIFLIARIGIFLVHYQNFSSLSLSNVILAFLYGFRFDLASLLVFSGIPLLLMALPFHWCTSKWWHVTLSSIVFFVFVLEGTLLIGDVIYFGYVKRHLTNELLFLRKDIKVVPNPYVMTNMMETQVSNPFLNQRRRLLFTHIPADCMIRIFTVSGVLVDVINVHNEPDNGIIHWDMLTRENLEIAAGMYIFQVESEITGDTMLGKFAVIK